MAIQLITDSASDIRIEEARQLGIKLLPMEIVFEDGTYTDGIELSVEGFYEKLTSSHRLPTTCQIPPALFAGEFEKTVAAGNSAIVITMSGKLSGTYQSAMIAAGDYPGKIFVVDSLNVTAGERLLVLRAKELIEQGLAPEEIVKTLERERRQIRVLGLLDTLEYLKKGGRISPATALAGTLLSVKPVVEVRDGEVAMVGKARGSRQGHNLLRQLVEKSGGIRFDRPYCLAYSGLSDALLRQYIADSEDLWKPYTDTLPIAMVGSTIGTHVGPGAIAVAFFVNA